MTKQSRRNPKSNNSELTYQKTLSTAEINFATYLKTKYRFPLVDIHKSSNGRVTWTFEIQDKDEAALANEFYRGGTVPAADYFSELKNLKSTTYTL